MSDAPEIDSKMATRRTKAGQPTSYRPNYVEQAFQLCVLGAIDREMADFFNVSESTINNWKKAHLEFLESIKRGGKTSPVCHGVTCFTFPATTEK